MGWLDRLFERHKFVRRVMVLWACWLISVILLRVFTPEMLPLVTGSVATVITAVIGILATALGFYQWSRNHERDERP